MKVIICGGRDFDDYDLVKKVMADVRAAYDITTIVQGGAKGADRLGKKWAMEFNFPVEEYESDWARHGKAAGIIRNAEMLEESGAGVVVAFPGGRGTFDMINRARRKEGVHLIVVVPEDYGLDN